MSRRPATGVAVLAVVLAGLAGCSDDDGRSLPAPTTSSTTSTTRIDYTQVSLPAIRPGEAPPVTRPPGTPEASIGGRVVDEDGVPVPGAFVRARYYGIDKEEVIEAIAGEDGTYRFDQLYGGRWRLRAWKEPTLATLEVPEFFLGAKEEKSIDLEVKFVPDVEVTASVAPDPPLRDELAEVAVLIVTQTVDSEGAVVRHPAPGVQVTLRVGGDWSFEQGTKPEQTTKADGSARWTMSCGTHGRQALVAVVFGRRFPLTVPDCFDPLTTSTTSTTGPSTSTTQRRTATGGG